MNSEQSETPSSASIPRRKNGSWGKRVIKPDSEYAYLRQTAKDIPRWEDPTPQLWKRKWEYRPHTILKEGRGAGSYRIYYVGEDTDIPAYKQYASGETYEVGDYLCDSFGVVAQIVEFLDGDSVHGRRVTIRTGFGTESGLSRKLNFFRPRIAWSSWSTDTRAGLPNRHLSIKDKAFLFLLIQSGDPYGSYEKVFQKDISEFRDKYLANHRIDFILKHPKAKQFMAESIGGLLDRKNFNAEVFVDKMLNSVPDTIDTNVQFNIWMTLGRLVPEVRKELDGEDPGGQKNLPQFTPTQEATFTEVCKLCGGTKRFRFTHQDQEMEIDCPVCKIKEAVEVQQRQLSDGTAQLRI